MKTILRTLVLFLFAAFPAFAAEGIAFISDMKGEVAVDGIPRPMLLSELAKGHDVMADDELPYFPEDAPRDADGNPIIRP